MRIGATIAEALRTHQIVPRRGEANRVAELLAEAVSTAEWTGVPLAEILDRVGVLPEAQEAVFRGADRGTVAGRPGEVHFERSLPVGTARESQALLAYAMNGEALPLQHGYPVRLVVPSWYGVASVKWLTAIDLAHRPRCRWIPWRSCAKRWTAMIHSELHWPLSSGSTGCAATNCGACT